MLMSSTFIWNLLQSRRNC